ncbi:6-phosphofructokinase [Halobacteroides halobius DSM 5150]|uniref:ATP-dependent 6-phosphofructokinase n=1 Tax=Halobacteroides halobius (strain ATCC 35273 / DSM 5150 / MD-1) TaxID=748449 RepID=L0K8E7_HALHC|nr:6-phosphofructokinase [Halobacteroides halobius]AGB40393.1 6-phosphofructokinase [Halobacteroides halobius DSM 5150]
MNKIGVLTSGGDAPGMNAAVRAVVRKALHEGLEVVGIKRGYSGVIEGDFITLDRSSVSDIIQRGGTFLRSARCEEFRTKEGRKRAAKKLREEGIEGLVVIGGDGSFTGAKLLNEETGIKTIGVPATIDNDIACTDDSIGYDTAMNTIIDAITKIRDTASSHERAFVIEAMGRHAGFLTLAAGLAGGAESILVPEIDFEMDEVCEKIQHDYEEGKIHSIVLVAEGVELGNVEFETNRNPDESPAFLIGREINERTGFETRVTILGHIQRGGAPTGRDRLLASRLGASAVDQLLAGKSNKMVGLIHNTVKVAPIEEAIESNKELNEEVYKLANILT